MADNTPLTDPYQGPGIDAEPDNDSVRAQSLAAIDEWTAPPDEPVAAAENEGMSPGRLTYAEFADLVATTTPVPEQTVDEHVSYHDVPADKQGAYVDLLARGYTPREAKSVLGL